MNKSEAFEQYWASLGMQERISGYMMRLIAKDVWAAAAAAEREACMADVLAYGGIHIYDASKIVETIRARGQE